MKGRHRRDHVQQLHVHARSPRDEQPASTTSRPVVFQFGASEDYRPQDSATSTKAPDARDERQLPLGMYLIARARTGAAQVQRVRHRADAVREPVHNRIPPQRQHVVIFDDLVTPTHGGQTRCQPESRTATARERDGRAASNARSAHRRWVDFHYDAVSSRSPHRTPRTSPKTSRSPGRSAASTTTSTATPRTLRSGSQADAHRCDDAGDPITLANAIKSDYSTHRASTTYHANADATNVITSGADATDKRRSARCSTSSRPTSTRAHRVGGRLARSRSRRRLISLQAQRPPRDRGPRPCRSFVPPHPPRFPSTLATSLRRSAKRRVRPRKGTRTSLGRAGSRSSGRSQGT